MSTLDMGPDADDDTWRDVLRAACRASVGHGEHVATAGCAHRGCTVWFVHGGTEDEADAQARAEGWLISGPDVLCPEHHSRATA